MLWRLGKVFPCAHAGDSSPDLSLRYMARTDFFYHLYVARHIGNLQWVGSFFSTPSECSLRLYETFTSFVNNFLAWLKAMRIFLRGLTAQPPCSFDCPRFAASSVSWPISLVYSLSCFRMLLFNLMYFFQYSSCNFALSLADLTPTNI